jgi:PAS domain S-box-containing protein
VTDTLHAPEVLLAPEIPADGVMARRVRQHDWAATPLGPLATWPASMRSLVGVMLAAGQPMFMAWGPERTWLYNDAFSPILGAKHPRALGRAALAEVWSEAEDVLAPLFERVFAGEPVSMDDFALLLDRGAGLKMAHFNFSYTPARDESGAVVGLFGVCTETTALVVGRQAAESAASDSAETARAAAERVDLALRAGAIVGTWVWDVPADRFLADAQFAASFGLDPELCRAGLPLETVMAPIHPEDRPLVAGAIADALARGGAYRREYRVRTADGAWRWIEASGDVELDERGKPLRFPGVLIDIHERRQTEEQLVQANRLLRTFMEAVPGVIYAKNRQGQILVGNRGTAQLLGREFDDFIGRTDMELLADKAEAAAIMATDRHIMETRIAQQVEEKVAFPDGTEAWWHSSKAPILDDRGEVIGLVGASVDITERRRAEEHRLFLLNELNHRVKNTLAVVQGIARQTFREAADTPVALDAFEARLAALSRAHNLLTDASWTAADLRDVVLDQLAQAGRRVEASGPGVMLTPQTAVSLALALHELGTNATKYGALSNETGRIEISWRVDADPPTLKLRWEEVGGPEVRPPQRRGFGSRMIERALAAELGGEVRVGYPPTGLTCEIIAPLAEGVGDALSR